MASVDPSVILYDFPLNEQVRSFLRLIALFRRALHFLEREDAWDHQAGVLALFEIIDATVRADVKSDLLQGLERQRLVLVALKDNPMVDLVSLQKTLAEIDRVMEELHLSKGKFGEHLRNHEGLMAIKQRAGIPGGLCDFDLPFYHYWLSQPAALRRDQIRAWIDPLLVVFRALELHIRLMLEGGKNARFDALRGIFQHSKVGPEIRLLRVRLSRELACVPEISANKYLLNIRFLEVAESARGRAVTWDVPFELIFCSF